MGSTGVALLVLLPAALLAILALTPPVQATPRLRMRRVPAPEPDPELPPDLEP